MADDVGVDGGLEVVPVQPLEQVGLDTAIGPVDLSGADEAHVLPGLPDGADDAGEQPECAAALVELLQGAEAVGGGVERRGWNG